MTKEDQESILTLARQNPRARGVEKRNIVICWLAEFHYSTRAVLARVLNLDPLGQGRFFKGLHDQDIVRSFGVPTIRDQLLLLTPNGVQHARTLTPHAVAYTTQPSKITSSTVVHSLSVQLAALNVQSDVTKITGERHLKLKSRGKLPDALIQLGNDCIALEVELTHKNEARIYRGFIEGIQGVKDGAYTRIRYVFTNPNLMNTYQRLFDVDRWPVYEPDPKSHRLYRVMRDGQPYFLASKDDRIRSLFEMVCEDLYR